MLAHLADRVLNRPLLIMPEKLAVIARVLDGRLGIDASGLAPDASRFVGSNVDEDEATGKRTGLPYRRTADGVGIITVVGSLVNRGAWVGASSGLVSYEGVKFQIQQAAADPKVKSILLDMDSPGGEATGAFETAAAVRAAAALKPVTAIVNGMAASAAYAIASGASRIVSSESGVSGSIGVVMMHADYSRMMEREGVTPTFIYAGAHKVDGNPYQPLPASVKSDLQAEVDRFYDMFVQTVADGRKRMSAKAIRATEARTFLGAQAKEIGLVDEIGTFEDVLSDVTLKARGRTSNPKRMKMSDHEGPALSQADMDRARAEAHAAGVAEGHKAGLEAGRIEGATAERNRIRSILGHEEAKGREASAQHFALNTGLSLEDTIGALAGVPKTSSLAERASSVETHVVEADAGKPAVKGSQPGAVSWDDIAADLNAKLPAARR